MANEKSLNAKSYINSKVNDMRSAFTKAPTEELKKKLIETFRETTSSDEYKNNLEVVLEDSDIIRKYAKRKKGGDITQEEFKQTKFEFYGKDMDLKFGEDFENLSKDEQYKYIIDKFGYTQYSFDCLMRYELVSLINTEARNNFSNLNNRSAQYLLNHQSYIKKFFAHIGSFCDFNETTLNILAEKLMYLDYTNGSFSEKDTKYLLNHIGSLRSFDKLGLTLLINYSKFNFGKGKDGLESMIEYLYRKLSREGIFIDMRDEFFKRVNKKSFEKYKLLPKNIKAIKVLRACDPLHSNECDKILLLDTVWNNKDVLEWYIRHYSYSAICNENNWSHDKYENFGISKDRLSQAQNRLQYMTKK